MAKRQADPTKRIAYMKAWRANNKAKTAVYCKKANRLETSRFRSLLRHAKARGLEVSISFEDYKILVSQPCFYCKGTLPEVGHGVDRTNSEIGYVQGNLRPCCTQCNIAKCDYTESEFKEWALSLYNNWAGK